jgi:ferrous iron transport protein B
MPRARSAVVIGNPNSGKSTLFNHLTGLNQKTANYPGVTVEKRSGTVFFDNKKMDLIDLPGCYSIYPFSEDERISIDVIKGNLAGLSSPDKIIYVLDTTQIYQGLTFLQQLSELNIPVVVALTMNDIATKKGIKINHSLLSNKLKLPVIPINAKTGSGLNYLIETIFSIETPAEPIFSIDKDSNHAEEFSQRFAYNQNLLKEIAPFEKSEKAQRSYAIIKRLVDKPLSSTILFLCAMFIVFQAVFAWATPLMDLIDNGATALSALVSSNLEDGALNSFVSDGIIAGVGSVIIFLPQILILFLFIILMEDTGYLSRAAFLSDRLMRSLGLSGQSIIPLLSSFACAVPSIMATRVIPNNRDRIVTILTAPFMTCSARLPIYALLIGAFVPQINYGFLNLQGLVLFGLYLLGIFGGSLTAVLLRKSLLKGPKPNFIQTIPEFRVPDLTSVLYKLYDRAIVFLKRAGTVILLASIFVWFLSYFPRSEIIQENLEIQLSETTDSASREIFLNNAAADQLQQSWLGRTGRTLEPFFAPLGWDWRVTSAVIAGFPAREVVVAVMGTIYAVGEEAENETLANRLTNAVDQEGNQIFTLPMVIGMLIFYAWCLQCVATIAIIRRETNSWKWPVISWVYMTTIGYLGAFTAFQVGSML